MHKKIKVNNLVKTLILFIKKIFNIFRPGKDGKPDKCILGNMKYDMDTIGKEKFISFLHTIVHEHVLIFQNKGDFAQ